MTSSVVIDPNPLFEGQGDPERVVPEIDVDPLADGILEGESVCSHGIPIKRGDRSSIYKNRTLRNVVKSPNNLRPRTYIGFVG